MKRVFRIILYAFLPAVISGQEIPMSNQYMLSPVSINPAYSGNRGALSCATFYRKQWVGVPGSPETLTLVMDGPFLEEKVGLGLILQRDKIGVTRETQLTTDYAYRIKMNEGVLSFGLGASLFVTNTGYSDLIAVDPGDEAYLEDSKLYVLPNFIFGAFYSDRNFFAGFSIPRLLGYQFDPVKNKYSLNTDVLQYTYMLHTGYLIDISRDFKILPSTLIKLSPVDELLFDLNLQVNFLEKFWLGLSYRNGRSVAGLAQFQLNNQLRLAYSYDFDTGELGKLSTGSHEIMLRYEFRFKVSAIDPLSF